MKEVRLITRRRSSKILEYIQEDILTGKSVQTESMEHSATNGNMNETTESLKHLKINFTMENSRKIYFESASSMDQILYIQKWMRNKLRDKRILDSLLKRTGDLEAISALFSSLSRETSFPDITSKLQNRSLVEKVVEFLKMFDSEKNVTMPSNSTISSSQETSSSSKSTNLSPQSGTQTPTKSPRNLKKPVTPRRPMINTRPARTFLSCLMIHLYPEEVLLDGSAEENATGQVDCLEGQLLCTAASMLVKATIYLHKASSELKLNDDLSLLKWNLQIFNFSRAFFNHSLKTWQKLDAERLAIELLAPYGQAYASLKVAEQSAVMIDQNGGSTTIGSTGSPVVSLPGSSGMGLDLNEDANRYKIAAMRQLQQMKQTMVTLIGKERADQYCDAIEVAVQRGENTVELPASDDQDVIQTIHANIGNNTINTQGIALEDTASSTSSPSISSSTNRQENSIANLSSSERTFQNHQEQLRPRPVDIPGKVLGKEEDSSSTANNLSTSPGLMRVNLATSPSRKAFFSQNRGNNETSSTSSLPAPISPSPSVGSTSSSPPPHKKRPTGLTTPNFVSSQSPTAGIFTSSGSGVSQHKEKDERNNYPVEITNISTATLPGPLQALLRNEDLAHELMINPDFRIEDPNETKSNTSSTTNSSGMNPMLQIKDTFHRLFWERLVVSLSTANQANAREFKEGDVVYIRATVDQGSYFKGVVLRSLKDQSDDTIDVSFDEGRKLEQDVKIERIRLKGDPLDPVPLLSLLDEVLEKFHELTPNRPDLKANLESKIDTEYIKQILERGMLTAETIESFMTTLIEYLISMQAPARAESTQAWAQDIKFSLANKKVDPNCKNEDLIEFIPKIFQYLFDKIDEVKRDTANAHIQMLIPYLQRNGIDYERNKFISRLNNNEIRMDNIRAWLKKTLEILNQEEMSKLKANSSGTEVSSTTTSLNEILTKVEKKDSATHIEALMKSWLLMLSWPVRLDTPFAPVPETLSRDAKRLASIRDAIDRFTLIGTYSAITKQFIMEQTKAYNAKTPNKINFSMATNLDKLQSNLHTLLVNDTSLRLPDIIAAVLDFSAKRIKELGIISDQDESEKVSFSLRNLLNNSCDPNHPVFKLMFQRVLDIFHAYLKDDTQKFQAMAGGHGSEFGTLIQELTKVAKDLRNIYRHDFLVHGALYSKIFAEEASDLIVSINENKID